MNKKILSLLAAALMALLFACSSDVAEDMATPQARINVFVGDANNGNQALAGANLKLFPSGQTGITSGEGTASFGGIPTGWHILYIDKEGYASAMKQVNAIANAYTTDNTEAVQLYKLSGSIIGFINYPVDDIGNSLPAEGATIRITLTSDDFVKKIIEVTADKDGKFVFENLPAVNGWYSIEALEFERTINGTKVKYENQILCTNLSCPDLASGIVVAPMEIYYSKSVDVGSFILLDHIELADSTTAVVLNFSDAIDVAKSRNAIQVKISSSYSSDDLPVDITYGNGDKTVTIKPLGKWKVAPYIFISYQSSNYLYSVKGKILNSTRIQVPIKPPSFADLSDLVVEGLKFNSTASQLSAGQLKLEWSKVDDATGYKIFVKAKEGSNGYADVSSCTGSLATASGKVTTEVNLSSCYSDLGLSSSALSDSVYFVVQAYNDGSKTKTLLNGVTPGAAKPPPPTNITANTPSCTFTPYDIYAITLNCSEMEGAVKYNLYATSAYSVDVLIYQGVPDEIYFGQDAFNSSSTIYSRLGFSDDQIFGYGNLKFYVVAVGGNIEGVNNVSNKSTSILTPNLASSSFSSVYVNISSISLNISFAPVAGAASYEVSVFDGSNFHTATISSDGSYWYDTGLYSSDFSSSFDFDDIMYTRIIAVDSFGNKSPPKVVY
jgi:hypothetical protein